MSLLAMQNSASRLDGVGRQDLCGYLLSVLYHCTAYSEGLQFCCATTPPVSWCFTRTTNLHRAERYRNSVIIKKF
jgi:hypothetical protein